MKCVFVLALATLSVPSSPAQNSLRRQLPQDPRHRRSEARGEVTVTDENGVAVASLRDAIATAGASHPLRCGTDFAGRCEFTDPPSGTCELRVEKIGFYAVIQPDVQAGVTASVDVRLTFMSRRAREIVNVVESAPAIDQAQVSSREEAHRHPDYRHSLPGVA